MVRKYNIQFRKKVATALESISNKEDLAAVFNIIQKDRSSKYSNNLNGIFIDINKLSDACMEELNLYINNIINNDNKANDLKLFINKLDQVDILTEIGHKLSSQERCIVKKLQYEP